jgi:MoaA/NifB/PqqE/SkfB family radical SAM enzyme
MNYSDFLNRMAQSRQLYSASLELTYQCNLDCFYCYNDRGISGRALDLEQYFQLLRDLRDLGTLFLTLTGGEPLAHPDFFRIAGYARELGFVIRIKSNGHALRGALAQRLVREVDPFNIDISLHGATAASHDRQTRVPGSFDRLLENLSVLQELGIRLKLNSTLTRWNLHEVEDMYCLAEGLGISLHCYTAVSERDDGDRSPRSIELSSAQKNDVLWLLHERKNRQTDPEEPSECDGGDSTGKHLDRPNCGAGVTNVLVDPVGNVLPCAEWRRPVGNLHQVSITDIWSRSLALKEVRAKNYEVGGMVDGLGSAGRSIGFCPGQAQVQTGSNTGMYPDSRLKLVFREHLHEQRKSA